MILEGTSEDFHLELAHCLVQSSLRLIQSRFNICILYQSFEVVLLLCCINHARNEFEFAVSAYVSR
jgi:hypothetical protein